MELRNPRGIQIILEFQIVIIPFHVMIEVSNRNHTFSRNVQFSLLPKIADGIPVSKLNTADLNIPASIELADTNFHMPGQIDILIGNAPVKTCKLSTVTYGTVSAPFLATRTSKALADEDEVEFRDAADGISNVIYMDDVLFWRVYIRGCLKTAN
ncbi:DUF1758 domain-containing protein [Nephila pilipes]|uniref:DUF1758 domain-containing protein n=1 Tax=Nephila pilipes TaxID=299642 RepID=A0A8X6NHB5_NEPPI|nr:DUF1758 domain-containing protein [Nephila pilipes]